MRSLPHIRPFHSTPISGFTPLDKIIMCFRNMVNMFSNLFMHIIYNNTNKIYLRLYQVLNLTSSTLFIVSYTKLDPTHINHMENKVEFGINFKYPDK